MTCEGVQSGTDNGKNVTYVGVSGAKVSNISTFVPTRK